MKESVLDRLFKKKKKKNSTIAPPSAKDADPSLNITVYAKFQFEATRDDELSLNKGTKHLQVPCCFLLSKKLLC